jgi:Type II secretion system (T2SS), protein E, N-terminal domain
VERLNHYGREQADDEQLALLYIVGAEQSRVALQQAALRIRCNVRCSDSVLIVDVFCAVVLPQTPLVGAQAVAKRISTLLVDVEYEMQILYGAAARTMLQRLQADQTAVVANVVEEAAGAAVQASSPAAVWQTRETDLLPYLAYLANYPSHRLFHLFPYELACRYYCVPVGAERGVLTLATCRQLDAQIISYFREITQRAIFLVRCEAAMIDDILNYWQRVIPA